MQYERESFEYKSQKILTILQQKDDQISHLTASVRELELKYFCHIKVMSIIAIHKVEILRTDLQTSEAQCSELLAQVGHCHLPSLNLVLFTHTPPKS